MPIQYLENSKTFHLYNDEISYIIKVLKEGIVCHLYFGAKLPEKENYDYLFESVHRPMSATWSIESPLSLEHIRSEYPSALSGDMRPGAVMIRQENGSVVSEFLYQDYTIENGKPMLETLPACYVQDDQEAQTLVLRLEDTSIQGTLQLFYTIYQDRPVICRSARIQNNGQKEIILESFHSASVDFSDDQFEMIDLAGAWARERNIDCHPLHFGSQSIYSLRGHSSHNFNPFLCLKRPWTTEQIGESYGFSLIYSGNFLANVDVDTYHTTRVSLGMHPMTFHWPLKSGESFQSPEAVLVYSDKGLNALSQTFHSLFRERLARGEWKNKVRPILLNSWEGLYFDVQESKVLKMAKEAKELGIELFVLDDGWFKGRNDDSSSLGDWIEDCEKLPGGLESLSKQINSMGMQFGLWIEPEMISENSDLYRSHPDWVLHTPNRRISAGRKQYVLDFSNPKVVDAIYDQISSIFDRISLSYVKWDMNRSLSEVYSLAHHFDQQGMVYHRYILGVYSLYEKLISRYPHILFESCASGGARFDPGMLYYAPQAWTSDDTDAIERLKIQYGTSMVYPICSMGSHVSACPNHQLNRNTPLKMRGDVAYFGTFGYELDPSQLTENEKKEIIQQIEFMKEYRQLIQYGTFYRLCSPFEGNETAWMIVSPDQSQAIIGYYRVLQEVNSRYRRLKLQGLNPLWEYSISSKDYSLSGDELHKVGLVMTDSSAGENNHGEKEGDFISRIFILNHLK